MQKHICSLKVFKTVRERTVQKSLQARMTNSERLFNSSTVSHVSDEKRKGGLCWLLYDE